MSARKIHQGTAPSVARKPHRGLPPTFPVARDLSAAPDRPSSSRKEFHLHGSCTARTPSESPALAAHSLLCRARLQSPENEHLAPAVTSRRILSLRSGVPADSRCQKNVPPWSD